jgi:rod shape-determining protein MreB
MAQATGLEVRLVEDPLSCVARGTSIYLENLTDWKDTLESDEDEL